MVDEYRLDRSKCVGIMLDGCAANLKALDALLLNIPNAVGVRCLSHLYNNCGNELDPEETDKPQPQRKRLVAERDGRSVASEATLAPLELAIRAERLLCAELAIDEVLHRQVHLDR